MTTTDMPTESARRLTRSSEDRIVAGVCSGAARYWDIDPVIPRVVLAVLAVFGGAGIAIYAVAWLLIPEDGSPSTRLERWLEGRGGDRGRDLLIVVVALFALSFFVDDHPFAHRISGAALVVVLVMVIAALAARRHDRARGLWPRQSAPTTSMPATDQQTVADQPTAIWQPMTARPPRERSWLGLLILALTLLTAGVLSIVAIAGWAHPQPADVVAACLGVVGVGLLVGTVLGRAWSVIPLGVLLVLGLGVADALPEHLTWSAGTRVWSTQGNPAPAAYVLGAGNATINLSKRDALQGATITGRLGAGHLIVEVPSGVAVAIHARASAGEIFLFGREHSGTGLDVRSKVAGNRPSAGTINLDLQVGFGEIEVENASA